MKHASYFPPSSAHRAIICPASVRLNAAIKGGETEAAAEGTVAHHIAEYCLTNDVSPHSLLDDWYHYTGSGEVTTDPLGGLDALWSFQCNEEMVAALSGYVAHCTRRPGKHFVEIRVDVSEWCPVEALDEDGQPIGQQTGTSDHVAIDIPNGVLYVDDLKYGKGVKVSPEENWQAISYALGTLAWLRKRAPEKYARIKTVVLGIYQPRIDNIAEWRTTVEHLLSLGDYMRERYTLAMQPNPPFQPDAKACQFCKVRPCQAEMEYISDQLIEGLDTEEPVTAEVIEAKYLLSPREAEELWLKKPWFESAFSKLHDFLFKRIANNEPSDLLRMGEGRGSRYWKNEKEAEHVLMDLGVEKLYSQKFVSPAKAEKQLNKKQKEIIAPLIGKKPGAPRLVPMNSDHRDYGSQLIDALTNLDGDDLGLD